MTEPLKIHRFAKIFPEMEAKAFAALVEDIEAHGLREPITRYQGKILEGRHRYQACRALKIEPRFEEFKGDDAAALALVVSRNFHRRHLTAKDRRKALVDIVAAQPGKSDRAIAHELGAGIDHKQIGRARRKGEATGAIDPVDKRKGTDGRTRRKAIKKHRDPGKAGANALVWKREGQGTGAKTSGGFYHVIKLDIDQYATHFWPNKNKGDAVSLGTGSTSLKGAKTIAEVDWKSRAKGSAPAPAPSGSFERWQAEAASAARATAPAQPERSEILAADARWAATMAASNGEAARKLYDLLRDDERRTVFTNALATAIAGSGPAATDDATTGNDTDATESAETRKALAEEGDDIEEEKPRRRGGKAKEVETTLAEAVHGAFTDLADLGGECRDVVDNAPEGLNQTQRISTLDETASELENLQEPEVPSELAELPVKYLPGRVRSRADRCYAATEIIQACVDVLAAIPKDDPRHAEASELSSELDDAITARDNCVFPGMYG